MILRNGRLSPVCTKIYMDLYRSPLSLPRSAARTIRSLNSDRTIVFVVLDVVLSGPAVTIPPAPDASEERAPLFRHPHDELVRVLETMHLGFGMVVTIEYRDPRAFLVLPDIRGMHGTLAEDDQRAGGARVSLKHSGRFFLVCLWNIKIHFVGAG